jgi:hypothetical protein
MNLRGPGPAAPFRCTAVIPADDADDVVLNPWPAEPDAVARSHRDMIARLGQIQVCALVAVPRPGAAFLASAGAALGVDQLIG